MHYKIVGKGPAVVFLHGFLEDHKIWNNVYPEFVNAGYTAVLVDLPCHGQSRFQGDICSMKQMANEVYNVLRENNLDPLFVLGHSMGGYVGFELLNLVPFKLILVHSNFWEDNEQKKSDRNRVIEIVKKNKSLFLNEAIPGLFAEQNREMCRPQIEKLINEANKIPSEEIAAATAGLRDRTQSYTQMNEHEVTLIQGDQDPIISNETLYTQIRNLIKIPHVIEIENCGHMSFFEQPAALISALKQVLIQ